MNYLPNARGHSMLVHGANKETLTNRLTWDTMKLKLTLITPSVVIHVKCRNSSVKLLSVSSSLFHDIDAQLTWHEVRGTAKSHARTYPLSGPFPRTSSRRSSLPHCGRTG